MTLIKRPLTETELQKIELQRHVSPERCPHINAEWVIDEERQLFCVQLVSSTYAMREGYYWYFLLHGHKQYIFMVDAFSAKSNSGQKQIEAVLDSSIAPLDTPTAKALAIEAILVLTNEKLIFVDKPFYSSM